MTGTGVWMPSGRILYTLPLFVRMPCSSALHCEAATRSLC